MALITAIMAALVVGVLGATVLLGTTAETMMAENFLRSVEAQYAAEAALERAASDVGASTEWNAVLMGLAPSAAVDGPPAGARRLADGSVVDLREIVNLAYCGHPGSCAESELVSVTEERPWGLNNPRWQLFAYAPLAQLLPPGERRAQFFVVVLAGDDPGENDNAPLLDGGPPATGEAENAGAGSILLRAEAFGPRGAHARVDAAVTRAGGIVSWRPVR
jgi:hypothetical protein